ncbi:MAG: hypothetical protein R3A44_23075 [Caldilineaceae bacterium]
MSIYAAGLNQERIRMRNHFERLYNRGLINRVLAFIFGRNDRLLSLYEKQARIRICRRQYIGVRNIPICQIRGSESRCNDFNQKFQPMNRNTLERWLAVATAYEKGVSLPAVEVMQVGEIYYVRDGHHRISVACANGQREIDAHVTVWEIDARDMDRDGYAGDGFGFAGGAGLAGVMPLRNVQAVRLHLRDRLQLSWSAPFPLDRLPLSPL